MGRHAFLPTPSMRWSEVVWGCVGSDKISVPLGLKNQVGDQMEMSGRQLDKSVQILQDDGLLYLGQTGLCLLFEL